MASSIYNNAKFAVNANGWTSGTWRVLLVNATYSPNIDTHVFVSAVTNELAGGTYVRKDLAGQAVAVDNANDRADYKADNVTWTALAAGGATAAAAVVYKFVTNDADSILIAYVDFPDVVTNGFDLTVKWDGAASNGRVFSIT
jgi:hypothetical protein